MDRNRDRTDRASQTIPRYVVIAAPAASPVRSSRAHVPTTSVLRRVAGEDVAQPRARLPVRHPVSTITTNQEFSR